jgi:hypothetical protein
MNAPCFKKVCRSFVVTNELIMCESRLKRSLSLVKENQLLVGSLQDFVHQSFWRSVSFCIQQLLFATIFPFSEG